MAISIHIPRVGDDLNVYPLCGSRTISIHIPRVGDDVNLYTYVYPDELFQSTSPVWGMTGKSDAYPFDEVISIHIPRVGDDMRRGWQRESE